MSSPTSYEQDLRDLLTDPSFDLPTPAGAVALVHRRARTMRRRRRALGAVPVLAIVVAAASLLQGVGASSGGRSELLGNGPSPAPRADHVRPVDGAAPAGTRTRLLRMQEAVLLAGRAQDVLLHECMTAVGQRYDDLPGGSGGGTLELSAGIGSSYGWTPQWVAAHGYGIHDLPVSSPRVAMDEYVRSLSPQKLAAWELAFDGSPDDRFTDGSGNSRVSGGCFGQSSRQLWGSDAEALAQTSFLGNLGIPVFASFDDPALPALDARWSSCMAAAGAAGLANPSAAVARARGWVTSDPDNARTREVALAEQDVSCEQSTGYAQDRRALEDRYLAGYAQQPGFDHAETVAAQTRQRAQEILDAHPESP